MLQPGGMSDDPPYADVPRRPRGDARGRRYRAELAQRQLDRRRSRQHEDTSPGGSQPVRLGFLTAPLPETPLMEVADWAAAAEFDSLEIACWPRSTGPARRYAGTSHIDVANLSQDQAKEIVDEISVQGPGHLRARLLSEPASRRSRASRLGHRPPQDCHRRVPEDGRAATSTRSWAATTARTSTRTGKRRSRSGPTSSTTPRTTA